MDITGYAVAGGVGVVDAGLGAWEAKERNNARAIGRIAGLALGIGLQVFMPRYSGLGDTIAKATIPLVVDTVAGQMIHDQVSSMLGFTARATGAPVGRPAGIPAGRSYYPQGEPVLTW